MAETLSRSQTRAQMRARLAQTNSSLEDALAKARSGAEDAVHILDTISFVVETAGQDCSNVTAMDHWLLVIDALASIARCVLNGEDEAENTSNGGAQ